MSRAGPAVPGARGSLMVYGGDPGGCACPQRFGQKQEPPAPPLAAGASVTPDTNVSLQHVRAPALVMLR